MPKKPTQASLFNVSVARLDEQQQEILRRLGLETLPTHETRWLPLERIQIAEENKVRVPKSLIQSIKQFGMLQPPSVVRCSPPDTDEEHIRYEVIAGRRRTKAAKLAGLSVLKVEDYAYSTPQLSALLALIENAQRSAAWVKEVADLRLLIDQRVGMTIKDLVACGFALAGLDERLKIAQLPAPILDQIVAGKVALSVARKLVRLAPDQLARVVQAAQDEPLSANLVKQALRVQIDAHLPPASLVFPEWEMPPAPDASNNKDVLSSETLMLEQVLTTLRAFARSDTYQHLEETHLLIQVLLQRLEVAARERSTAPQSLAG